MVDKIGKGAYGMLREFADGDGITTKLSLSRDKAREIVAEVERRCMALPLDADGVPIRPGDTVWNYRCEQFDVTHIGEYGELRCFDEMGFPLIADACCVTHKKPAPKALDADGVECKVGDTVWNVEHGWKGEVIGIEGNGSINVAHEHGVCPCEPASHYTHTEPDSWERLEHELEELHGFVSRHYVYDLVLRAKALAGVSE